MFGQLARKKKAYSCLNFPRANGRFLVVVRQAGSFASDTLKYIVDERVHDTHGLTGDTSVGMDLLHDFVNVDRVTLFPFPVPLFLVSAGLLAALFGYL